jgi:hypothetical protein
MELGAFSELYCRRVPGTQLIGGYFFIWVKNGSKNWRGLIFLGILGTFGTSHLEIQFFVFTLDKMMVKKASHAIAIVQPL